LHKSLSVDFWLREKKQTNLQMGSIGSALKQLLYIYWRTWLTQSSYTRCIYKL